MEVGTRKDWLKIKLSDGSSFFCLRTLHGDRGWDVGSTLDEVELQELVEQNQLCLCGIKARELAARKEETFTTLGRKLLQRGWKRSQIDPVLEDLKVEGFIDHLRYGSLWVESRTRKKQESREMLALGLKERGLSRDEVLIVLDTVDDQELFDRAWDKLRNQGEANPEVLKRKLLRKGFSFRAIQKKITTLLL